MRPIPTILAALAVGAAAVCFQAVAAATPLVIAPLVEGAQFCQSAAQAQVHPAEAEQYCRNLDESTSARLQMLLSEIDGGAPAKGDYVLGHTHTIPLFRMLRPEGDEWVVDTDRLRYSLRPVVELDRPVVLYLFANHFGVDVFEGSFEHVMMAREENLMRFPDGTIARDNYFTSHVIPWTISDLNAPVNRYRDLALKAVVDELCALPDEARGRIVAVNLLGEIHDLFPNFQSGMGFDVPMVTTDYSSPAVAAFRQYLRDKYGDIATLNRYVGAAYADFDAVQPPHKDIRTQRLSHFTEHLDAYAHGSFPVTGWAAAPRADVVVDVYLNGALVATGLANQNRQDVLEAKPELGTANVGFRFDVPFNHLPPGVHKVVVAATVQGETTILGEREIAIMDRKQSEPARMASHTTGLAPKKSSSKGLEAWLDYPQPLQSFYYNPLAALWLEFRNHQVRAYLEHYAGIAASSCLRPDQLFIHQIAPQMNASWNHNLMAVDASLEPSPAYNMGINLYGGAAYGGHFFQWKKGRGIDRYGVPEFHPMRPLSEEDVATLLMRHKENGAAYIAPYYITGIPSQMWKESDHNKFRISSANTDYGSDTFFRGLQRVLVP